jgi:glycosyltransferase involved in cell wall biosynthesis
MRTKRVFIVDEHISSKQNGVGTYMQCLLECMRGLDVEVNYISFNSEETDFSVYERDGCHYYCFPICNGGRMLESGELCWPILKMYVTDNEANMFFINHSPCVDFLESLRQLYKRSQIVFTIHDQGWTAPLMGNRDRLREIIVKNYSHKKKYEAELFCKSFFRQECKMYTIADLVICLCESTKKLLCDTYKVPIEKIHLIPNGCHVLRSPCSTDMRQQIREELGINHGERLLLFVGRTVKAKGLDDLLMAYENLWIQDKQLRLVVVGEVFRLNELAKLTPNSATHITYTGLISQQQLKKWYAVADIGVLPSYTEQCSYTGIEMMAHNVLIVTTDGNGLTDMFCHGYNALVASIKPQLSENLEKTLMTAIGLSEEARAAICQNARGCVEMRYSLSIMRDGYRSLL